MAILGPGLFPTFSIEAWIKPASGPVYFPSIAGINGTNYDFMMLSLNDNGGGGFVNFSANSIASGWQVTSADGSIVAGTTYHIVGTWDGSTAIIYINGFSAASISSSEVIQLGQSESFYAGSDQFGTAAYDGVMDEVAFYLTTLAPTRVTAHHSATSTYSTVVLADAPLIYWRFGDTAGAIAHDSSGNNHDGAVANAPTFGATGLVSGNSDTAIAFARASNQYVSSGVITGGGGGGGGGTGGTTTPTPTATFAVQVVNAANVRDTTINVIPLSAAIDAGATGTGTNPVSYTVTATFTAPVGSTTISIQPNPQYIVAGSTVFFTSAPNTPVTVTADAPVGATSLEVAPLTTTITAGTASSGSPVPPPTSDPAPLGPGDGIAPPAEVNGSPVVKIQRVSLRYPPPAIDADGFPVQ